MSTSVIEKSTSTNRPSPGPRVAPPTPGSFVPWVTALEQPETPDRYAWVMAEEGVLVPVPNSDEADGRQSAVKALAARVAARFRR
jgi:hypothetical protein